MIFLLTIPFIAYFTFFGFKSGLSPHNLIDWFMMVLSTTVLTVIISIVPVGIAVFIGTRPKVIGVPDKEYPLIALREKDGLSGQFYFLGAGSISDRQYYFWYRRTPDGSISGGKTARVPEVRIYEQDGPPKTITFKSAYKYPLPRYFWLIGLDWRNLDWYEDFYIPP